VKRARTAGALAALSLLSGTATAHEIAGTRFDAPLPLPLLFGGAGVTVAATAWWLARTDGALDWTETSRWRLPAPALGRRLLQGAGLSVFAAVLGFGLFGPRIPAENPAVLVTWAIALKGIGVVSVVAGSPWRWLSPWRTLYDALAALEGSDLSVFDYPEWLGAWPATAWFVVLVGVVENVTEIPGSPRLTAAFVAAYALYALVGGLAFGSDFFERADALAVLYRLLGSVSPLDWREGTVALRAPWRTCSRPPDYRGVAAFVVAAVYTVSFDGFSNTPEYQDAFLAATDVAGVYAQLALYVAGLLAFLLAYAVTAALVARLGAADTADRGWRPTAAAFAPTVVPIAAAYEVAHNYPFVARNLAAVVSLVDGVSVSLLGWLPLPAFWASQVVLVVAGHLLAVVAAHRVAVRRYGDDAARAHLPLVVLMVGYTVLSLWIVSRPVVA
jgi:hypothetical protein